MSLYDMGRRITELVLRRDAALTFLHRATKSEMVNSAIRVLEDEPDAGEPGGPSRTPAEALAVRGGDRIVSAEVQMARVERMRLLGLRPGSTPAQRAARAKRKRQLAKKESGDAGP